ncbi:hypothetical protein [Sphaerisporangium album]|uniref:hypothetical protein n=1 Tax=Sphaerisporangium album TaxID=509200 RepID=UPI0015F0F287|nr:hypothetical protein [Sphaerisporangium album]
MRDRRARLSYLDEVITLLYPPVNAVPRTPGPYEDTDPSDRLRATGEPTTAYALTPSRFLPRRLVPRSRWLPGRRRLPGGSGTIEGHLSEVFGQHVGITLHVRPARRANRKPVLEVRAATGERLAFVKMGDTDRARALVRHEAMTLALLAVTPLKTVVVPTILHHGTWNDLEVLALSPLPIRRLRRVPHTLFTQAVVEIATLGLHPSLGTPAACSDPLDTITVRPEPPAATARSGPSGTTPPSPGPPGTATAGPEPLDTATTRPGPLGGHCWHGDFSPWNIAPSPDGRLLVWDWERFGGGVPLGFDALHHFFQRALRRMPPDIAAAACLAHALPTLAPYGLSAAQARETAVHYLITLADRHERDGHHPLGPPSRWLSPLVDPLEVLT